MKNALQTKIGKLSKSLIPDLEFEVFLILNFQDIPAMLSNTIGNYEKFKTQKNTNLQLDSDFLELNRKIEFNSSHLKDWITYSYSTEKDKALAFASSLININILIFLQTGDLRFINSLYKNFDKTDSILGRYSNAPQKIAQLDSIIDSLIKHE